MENNNKYILGFNVYDELNKQLEMAETLSDTQKECIKIMFNEGTDFTKYKILCLLDLCMYDLLFKIEDNLHKDNILIKSLETAIKNIKETIKRIKDKELSFNNIYIYSHENLETLAKRFIEHDITCNKSIKEKYKELILNDYKETKYGVIRILNLKENDKYGK